LEESRETQRSDRMAVRVRRNEEVLLQS
jgi:hypothetical protein